MALEFTRDAPAADAGLSIRFDLRGLQDLLAAMHGAMAEGACTIGGGASPAAFGAVTFAFAEPRDDRRAGRTPTPPPALAPPD